MSVFIINKPVTEDLFFVWVIVLEKRIRDDDFPNSPVLLFPSVNFFRPFDDDFFTFSTLIGNSAPLTYSGFCWFTHFRYLPLLTITVSAALATETGLVMGR